MAADNTLSNRAAAVLHALKRHFDVTDQEIADATDGEFSRSQIEARRAGRKTLDLDDLELLGRIFDLPATVFLMDPSEAIRFALDNPPTQGFASSRCTRPWQPTLWESAPETGRAPIDFGMHATAA